MATYGIGIWGAGATGGDHLAAYLAQANCHVVAIGSLNLTDARNLANRFGVKCTCYTDYSLFLSHPGLDVVSICTPHHLHADNTIEAAQAGKHVYVEKPVAVTLSSLYAMRQAVRDTGVFTVSGFVVRWIPLVERLHQLVREGALGELRVVDVDYWHSRRRPVEYRRRVTGGSAMLLGGCHAIDTAMFLTDAEPVEVVARSVQIGAESGDEYEFDCAELCLVRYSNNAIGRISAVVKGHMPYQFNIDLLGNNGTARNNCIFLQEDTEQTGFQKISESGPERAKAEGLPYQKLIRYFLSCIESKTEPSINLEHAVQVHEVCFAALLSESTGSPVSLPLNERDQLAIHNLLK
ncbi:MAG: Gfo/Idh/MocA family oxidoreductase [Ardenticatenaceae bacterium]|nr:Gfo/Idh/MocA family oxidoreductase [Ardenticatenaceae bacterium]